MGPLAFSDCDGDGYDDDDNFVLDDDDDADFVAQQV